MITYAIQLIYRGGQEDCMRINARTENQAIAKITAECAAVKEMSKADRPEEMYLTMFRATDGQHGYLNRDGSFSVTGQSWI